MNSVAKEVIPAAFRSRIFYLWKYEILAPVSQEVECTTQQVGCLNALKWKKMCTRLDKTERRRNKPTSHSKTIRIIWVCLLPTFHINLSTCNLWTHFRKLGEEISSTRDDGPILKT